MWCLFQTCRFNPQLWVSINQYFYQRSVCLSVCVSVGGFSQGLCFCGPVPPGGRCGRCRGCQRTGQMPALLWGRGARGDADRGRRSRPCLLLRCAVTERAPHWCNSALLQAPRAGPSQPESQALAQPRLQGLHSGVFKNHSPLGPVNFDGLIDLSWCIHRNTGDLPAELSCFTELALLGAGGSPS